VVPRSLLLAPALGALARGNPWVPPHSGLQQG
jgi:hypothetical protein